MHEGSPDPNTTHGLILDLARAGKLAGLTIINNVALANTLVDYVPYVILRVCRTDHDPSPDCRGDDGDYTRGYNTFKAPFWWDTYYQADPRIILQYNNETNWQDDDTFFCGLGQAAYDFRRKVIFYNDSVGATTPEMWLRRRPSRQFALEHQMFAGIHAYGDVTKGGTIYCPMIDPAQPTAYQWFFGRFEWLYALDDVRPPLILNEAGAGGYQTNATVEQWLADIDRVKARVAALPYVKAFNLWTVGGAGDFGFERDCLDGWLERL